MNERIRELARQATTIEYGVDNGFDRVTFNKEKFAELIVRECAEVANNHFESKEPGYPGDKVEEHFGVEE